MHTCTRTRTHAVARPLSFSIVRSPLLFRPVIDVRDWRAHTSYSNGFTAQSHVIAWFWETVEAFSQQELTRLLQFGRRPCTARTHTLRPSPPSPLHTRPTHTYSNSHYNLAFHRTLALLFIASSDWQWTRPFGWLSEFARHSGPTGTQISQSIDSLARLMSPTMQEFNITRTPAPSCQLLPHGTQIS